jgi:rod shape-determining protein MreB and related proteins
VGVVSVLQRALWSGVAVDLGTVNTLVYMPGRGVVLDEPSVLAVRRATGDLVAVGSSAAALWGRAPSDVEVIKPLHDGVISDPDACSLMLQGFLGRVWRRHRFGRLGALVCVPGCATDVERRALVVALSDGRPHFHVTLVEEPVAAALGSAVELDGGNAVLIVDIGGGTTEMGVVVGGGTTEMGVVVGGGTTRSRSIRVGGNEMDAAIVQAVRTHLGLIIGERTAERVKMALGLTGNNVDSLLISGVDPAKWGQLRTVEVTPALVRKALERTMSAILTSLADLLAGLPPDLAQEVLDQGVYLAGGGALLRGVAVEVAEKTGCRATVVDDPLKCVLRGRAVLLDHGSQHSHAA